MIDTREQFESLEEYADFAQRTGNNEAYEYLDCVETIEALRKAIKQAPKIIKRESGINPCAFCMAYPAHDHYAHCAYAALPDWLKDE